MAEVDDHKERVFSTANFEPTPSVFKRPSYLYVFPAIFLYFLVLFGIFPLAFQVHIDQVCKDLNEDDCESSNVSAQASTLNLLTSLASSICSILTCGIYGSIADVYGRKIVIITPFIGLMVYAAAYLFVDSFHPAGYVPILVAANAIMGLSGSYIVFIMGSLCYTSDATMMDPQSRRHVYSYAEATIMTPEVFGPVLTGIWASYYGFFLPLLLGVIFSGIAILYVALLPESLPPDAESRNQPLQLNPLQTFTNVMFLFTYRMKNEDQLATEGTAVSNPIASGHSRTEDGAKSLDDSPATLAASTEGPAKEEQEISPLPYVGVAFLLYFMALMGQSAVRIVYVTHQFGWDSGIIGVYDGMEGFVVSMSMVFAPYVIQRVMCFVKPLSLLTWVQIGLLSRIVHWTLFGLVRDTYGIFLLLPLLFFVGPMAPYTRTIMSNTVTHAEQAKIFSAFSALEGIASLLAPLYSAGYTLFVQAGAAWMIFEVMAVATAMGLVIMTYVRFTPSLSKHIPEDHHPRFHGEEGGEGRAGAAAEGLLDAHHDAHGRALSVGSVRSTSSRHFPVADETTLQFRHLSRASFDEGPVGASTSVDRGLHGGNTLTARLLAEHSNAGGYA